MSDLAHPSIAGFTFDAFDDGWSTRDTPAPCVVCERPAFCRDPDGRPRHRVDCLEGGA